MTDVNAAAAGGRGPGRPRKKVKRLALSLRVTPELRGRLMAMAKENSRSITQQTELLLEQAIDGGGLGVSPASVEKHRDSLSRRMRSLEDVPGELAEDVEKAVQRYVSEGNPLEQRVEALRLFWSFDRQTMALLLLIGFAMAQADLETRIWCQDAVERTRQLRAKKASSGSTVREIEQVIACLRESAPSDMRSRLPNDAYTFGQAVDAARKVLETVAPEGDPTMPPPPRGMDPLLAVGFMQNVGAAAGEQLLHALIDEENRSAMSLLGRAWLGEDVVARLRRRLSEEPAPEPTDG